MCFGGALVVLYCRPINMCVLIQFQTIYNILCTHSRRSSDTDDDAVSTTPRRRHSSVCTRARARELLRTFCLPVSSSSPSSSSSSFFAHSTPKPCIIARSARVHLNKQIATPPPPPSSTSTVIFHACARGRGRGLGWQTDSFAYKHTPPRQTHHIWMRVCTRGLDIFRNVGNVLRMRSHAHACVCVCVCLPHTRRASAGWAG